MRTSDKPSHVIMKNGGNILSKDFLGMAFDFAMKHSYNSSEPPLHKDDFPKQFRELFFSRLGTFAFFNYCIDNHTLAYYRVNSPTEAFKKYTYKELRIGTCAVLTHSFPSGCENIVFSRSLFNDNGEIESSIEEKDMTAFFDMHAVLRYSFNNPELDMLFLSLDPVSLDKDTENKLKNSILNTQFRYEITGFIYGEYFTENIIHTQKDYLLQDYHCSVSELKPFSASVIDSLHTNGEACFLPKENYDAESLKNFQYSIIPLTLTAMASDINSLMGKGTINVKLIMFHLIRLGFLQKRYIDGHKTIIPTNYGRQRGLVTGMGRIQETKQTKITYTIRAQRIIVTYLIKLYESRQKEKKLDNSSKTV